MEVTAKLQFLQPCYGNERTPSCDYMLRGPNQLVLFKKAWWVHVLGFATKAVGRYYREVKEIEVDPEVLGDTTFIKRWYSSAAFKNHEVFDKGTVIEVRFWLPNGLNPDNFKELLEVAGKYKGISPYGHELGLCFGKFSVLSVSPLIRRWSKDSDSAQASFDKNSRQFDTGDPFVPGVAGQ